MIMRIVQVAAIVSVLFCLGLAIYIEIDTRNFSNSLPQSSAVEQHEHGTLPGDASHTHDGTPQAGITDPKKVPETYDWRTDDKHAHSHTDADPWSVEVIFPDDEETAEDESDEEYPPRNWYETSDPALYAEYYYAQVFKQFSDVPGIEALAESLAAAAYKLEAEIPLTIDEAIARAKAANELWPDEDTQRSIESLEKIKASGEPYRPTYGPIRKPRDEAAHLESSVQPLIDEFGEVEGILIFKMLDPQGAMTLKRAMLQNRSPENKALIESLFSHGDLLKFPED